MVFMEFGKRLLDFVLAQTTAKILKAILGPSPLDIRTWGLSTSTIRSAATIATRTRCIEGVKLVNYGGKDKAV